MRKELSELLKVDIETVNKFFDNYLVDPRNVTRYFIMKEFKQIKSKNPDRSNNDIYLELSEKHNVCESSVYKWVRQYS